MSLADTIDNLSLHNVTFETAMPRDGERILSRLDLHVFKRPQPGQSMSEYLWETYNVVCSRQMRNHIVDETNKALGAGRLSGEIKSTRRRGVRFSNFFRLSSD